VPDLPVVLSQILVIALWLGAVFTVASLMRRVVPHPELVRKVVHIGTGHVILWAWLLHCSIYLCLAIASLFTLISYLSYWQNILPFLDSVGRDTRGVFYYSLSITLLVAIFWRIDQPQFAVLGVMVMTWGDGLAALVGQKWGVHKYKIGNNQRSLEGSATMLLTSGIVCYSIIHWLGYPEPWLISMPTAVTGTVLEAISQGGTDNLTVPLATALVSFALCSQGLQF
jgi:phytol kinase